MSAYPIDNLSLWMEVRYHDLGPHKDHLLVSVKHYEAKIKSLEEYVEKLEARNEDLFATKEDLEEKLLHASMDGYDMAKEEYRELIRGLDASLDHNTRLFEGLKSFEHGVTEAKLQSLLGSISNEVARITGKPVYVAASVPLSKDCLTPLEAITQTKENLKTTLEYLAAIEGEQSDG